jgi:hypothetical protein
VHWNSQYAVTLQAPKIKSTLQVNWLTALQVIQTVHKNKNEPSWPSITSKTSESNTQQRYYKNIIHNYCWQPNTITNYVTIITNLICRDTTTGFLQLSLKMCITKYYVLQITAREHVLPSSVRTHCSLLPPLSLIASLLPGIVLSTWLCPCIFCTVIGQTCDVSHAATNPVQPLYMDNWPGNKVPKQKWESDCNNIT